MRDMHMAELRTLRADGEAEVIVQRASLRTERRVITLLGARLQPGAERAEE